MLPEHLGAIRKALQWRALYFEQSAQKLLQLAHDARVRAEILNAMLDQVCQDALDVIRQAELAEVQLAAYEVVDKLPELPMSKEKGFSSYLATPKESAAEEHKSEDSGSDTTE